MSIEGKLAAYYKQMNRYFQSHSRTKEFIGHSSKVRNGYYFLWSSSCTPYQMSASSGPRSSTHFKTQKDVFRLCCFQTCGFERKSSRINSILFISSCLLRVATYICLIFKYCQSKMSFIYLFPQSLLSHHFMELTFSNYRKYEIQLIFI